VDRHQGGLRGDPIAALPTTVSSNRLAPILVVAMTTFASSPASAQETQPPTAGQLDVVDIWNKIRNNPPAADDEPPKRMKAVAPVIGVKPSAGIMLGVAGNVAFFLGEPSTTHISSLVASLTFSEKSQTSLTGRFALTTSEDLWRVEGDNRAQWTSQDTYGLGTSSEVGSAVNAKYDFFRIRETVMRQLRPALFAGAGLVYDIHTNIHAGTDVSDPDWNATSFVEYSEANGLPLDRQVSAGASIVLVGDTRDNAINPYSGGFVEARYSGFIDGFLGGSTGWQLLHADGRAYWPIGTGDRRRLALWLFGDFTFAGTAPYFDLPSTGVDTYGRSGRGYGEGRFRGERLLYGEIEYRSTITQNRLLGWVAFFNMTSVSNLQQNERLFDSGAPGAGAGLRVLINKRSRTNLCFDVGFGRDGSKGVYLAVQEAF